MHLGFLTPEYPHEKLGHSAGLGTSIKNMVGALVKNEVKATIFVYGQQIDEIFKDGDVVVHSIKKRKYKIGGWYLHRKFIQRYVNKVVLLKKINAIEAPDWTGITAFMKFKCPLVIRFNGSDSYFCKIEGRKQKKKNFYFEKLALQGADYLLSVSEFTAQETRKIFDLKKEIQVIPNSIDINVFAPDESIKVEPFKMLYFGTIIRKKGVLEIPEIFNRVANQIPNAEIYFAGGDVVDIKTGNSTCQLMMSAFDESHKSKVHYLGKLPYGEIKKEIQSSAVIILPSYAEALPMTWIEAMAMEKALVTSNVGWAEEVMVDGETGYTVNPRNHQEYADRIIELLNDESLRQQMGKAARIKVEERFSNMVVAKKNIDFYRNIVK
ncbi:MAG: glycosyl transferase [Cytophagaceae bacterium]|nr:glycosyl transferase [Cytophagaceae bacterium]|tara:strand:+ start:25667 stop:26806 length:1140 start_codon:yes stop_codon:yes gene_type:complete